MVGKPTLFLPTRKDSMAPTAISVRSHVVVQEWPAKVLGLASYGQDKLVESVQLSATAESNAVQWCTYFL